MKTMGLLVILATWAALLACSLRIHSIDNAAAQASLVCGFSSVASGDDIVGLTWGMTAHQRIIPWFDRVGSASSLVDGLSRGRQDGPWHDVRLG